MAKPDKFLLPSPNFNKNVVSVSVSGHHYLTPCGMTLLPRAKQPPPMYGPRGATLPAKFLKTEQQVKHHIDSKQQNEALVYTIQYCETCDMKLNSNKNMQLHLSQHENCPVDGCDFSAHSKILDKHIEALHVTGLYNKVRKMCTPEEIAAWREERRKRYPTVANVEQCKLAREQRQRRGERLEAQTKRFGRFEDRKRAHNVSENKCRNQSVEHPGIQSKTKGVRKQTNAPSTVPAKKPRKPRRQTKAECVGKQLGAPIILPVKESEQQQNQIPNNKCTHKSKPFTPTCSRKLPPDYSNDKPESDKQELPQQHKQFNHCESKSKDVGSKEEICCGGITMFRGTNGMSDYKHFVKKKNALSNILGIYESSNEDDDDSEDDCEMKENGNHKENSISDHLNKKVKVLENEFTNEMEDSRKFSKLSDINTDKVDFNSMPNKSSTEMPPILNINDFIETSNLKTNSSKEVVVEDSTECFLETSHAKTDMFNSVWSYPSVDAPAECLMEISTQPTNSHDQIPIEHTIEALSSTKDPNNSSDEAPDETPIEHKIETSAEAISIKAKMSASILDSRTSKSIVRQKKRKSGLNYRKAYLRKQNTLLEKLLETQIRHERNVLLQCVRFVCENNYFENGQSKNLRT